MAAEKGRGLLLKAGDVATGVTIGCQLGLSVTINNEQVDITNKDSAGKRQLLEAAGTQSVSLSGNGVFDGDAAYATLEASALANTIDTYSIFWPDATTWEFSAAVASLELGGNDAEAQTYSLTLEVSGTIAIA